MFGYLEETVATNNNDIDLVCKITKEDCTYLDFRTDGCNRIEAPPVFKIMSKYVDRFVKHLRHLLARQWIL